MKKNNGIGKWVDHVYNIHVFFPCEVKQHTVNRTQRRTMFLTLDVTKHLLTTCSLSD